MSATSAAGGSASRPDDLLRRVLRLLEPGHARFILVRSAHHLASIALIVELMDRLDGGGHLVLHPPVVLRPSQGSPPSPTRPGDAIPATDTPGSRSFTARLMGAANTLVLLGPKDVMMEAFWLPPSVLEGYAQLPPSTEVVLVVDDWRGLVEEFLGGTPSGDFQRPDARDLDPLLVEMFHALSEVHFIVVTSRISPPLEAASDAVLDVVPIDSDPHVCQVRLLRDRIEPPPVDSYVLRLTPSGFLAVER